MGNPTSDSDRIRFVTRHFADLQVGLRFWVPMGLVYLGTGLGTYADSSGGLVTHSHPVFLRQLGMVLVVGGFLAMLFSGRYLRRRFGKVERAPESFGGRKLLLAFLAVFAFVLLTFTDLFGNSHGVLASPVRLQYLSCGLILLSSWISMEHRLVQGYHLVLGALLLGLAAPGELPFQILPASLLLHPGTDRILSGSAMIVAGLLDHWQLVRTLQPLPEPDEEAEASALEVRR